MLVKFRSSTSGEVIMFAEHARRLFDIVGKEGSARGVFTREQLADAIARLHHAVDEEKRAAKLATDPATKPGAEVPRAARAEPADDDEEAEKKAVAVSLAQRAHPLIQLMERTDQEDGFILWEAARDF